MINLSCNFKEIKINKNLSLNDTAYGFKAHSCAGIAKALQAKMESEAKTIKLNKMNLKDYAAHVIYIEKARDLLIRVRTLNSSRKRAENLRDELNNFVTHTFYSGIRSKNSKLCKAGEYAINNLSGGRLYYAVSSEDFLNKYDCLKQSQDDLTEFYNYIMTFPYKDNGIKSKDITDSIRSKRDNALDVIKAYEYIAEEAKEDIVNWSQHKISRRLTTGGFTGTSYWNISGYISDLIEHYKKMGVIPCPAEKRGKSSKQKIEDKINNQEELSQKEVLSYFKTACAGDSAKMIPLMTFETILELFNATTKNVSSKLEATVDVMIRKILIERACELAPDTEKDFKTVLDYAKDNKKIEWLTWDFIIKNKDRIGAGDLQTFAILNKPKELSTVIYDQHFKDLPVKVILNINTKVTKEFVRRLNNEDKISIFTRLAKNFIKTESNAASFMITQDPWDALYSLTFDNKDIEELYKDVDWNAIKHTIQDNRGMLRNSINLILKNKDKELAETALKQFPHGFEFEDDIAVKLFELFTPTERIRIMLEVSKSSKVSNAGYERILTEIISEEKHILKLFKGQLEYMGRGYLREILNSAKKNKCDMQLFRDLILNTDYISSFPLTTETLKLLDKKCKLHLLSLRTQIVSSNTSHFSHRSTGGNESLIQFLKGLTKKEITTAIGSTLPQSQHRKYLAHLMTEEERIESCEKDSEFLRFNLSSIPYSYLKKYKDKKLFKTVVGDQRDSGNKNFASRLNAEFEKMLEKKVNPANTVKFMS